MNSNFARDFAGELKEMDRLFAKTFSPWLEKIDYYVQNLQNDLNWIIMPRTLLSIFDYLNVEKDMAVHMTVIFRSAYLGTEIHALVKDDEEGQVFNPELQFNILFGDHIFGHLLKLLLNAGAEKYLSLLAEMICRINEGMLYKYKLGAGHKVALQKTTAPFYSTAFLMAARLKEVDNDQEELVKALGYNMGMSIGLLNYACGFSKNQAFIDCTHCLADSHYYLNKSKELLGVLALKRGKSCSRLENLIADLTIKQRGLDRAIAI
ncbi:MAG: hypothetical protein ACOX0E_08245 [Syntrophomonadaceae bacterium]|jgi:hypothetical protein